MSRCRARGREEGGGGRLMEINAKFKAAQQTTLVSKRETEG